MLVPISSLLEHVLAKITEERHDQIGHQILQIEQRYDHPRVPAADPGEGNKEEGKYYSFYEAVRNYFRQWLNP